MNKKKVSLFVYMIVLLILLIPTLISGDCWIDLTGETPVCRSLSPGESFAKPTVTITAYDSDGNIIDDPAIKNPAEFFIQLSVPGFWRDDRNVEGEFYSSLISYGMTHYEKDIGSPEVPKKVILLEIPSGTEPEVSITVLNDVVFSDITIYPVQPPKYDSTGADNPPFQRNDDVYTTNAFYPENTILSTYVDGIRNHRYLAIELTPVRYNPVLNEALMAQELVCRVNLRPSEDPETFLDPVLKSYAFDNILGKNTFNSWIPYKASNYLIIMNDQFLNHSLLEEFIEWKRLKGNCVRIVTTGEITPSGQVQKPEHIKSFLESLSAEEYPEYLLLIGDSQPDNGVVTYMHSGTPTDYFYSCKNNPLGQPGAFPDLFMGRLPAGDSDELTSMLTKIIHMDRTPPDESNDYYNTVLTTGSISAYPIVGTGEYQDGSIYTETIDAIACHFEQNNECFRVIKSNNHDIEENDICHWDKNGPILWQGAGQDVHMGPRILGNYYKSNVNVTNILIDHLNTGVVIYHYRGHGNKVGFDIPYFTSGQVLSLTNGDFLPLIFGTTCSIAASYHTSKNNFARRWLNKPLGINNAIDGGGYAVIGATRQSNPTRNNYYTYGLFGAFINDFFSWFNNSTDPNWTSDLPLPNPENNYFNLKTGSAKKLGQMIFFGMAYLKMVFGPVWGENLQYHLFGDPEAEIIFHEPQDISVSITPSSIPSVATTEVTVYTGEDGLQVSLYNLNLPALRRPMKRITHNGKATFNVWTGVYVHTEKLHVTVTGFGKRPYEGSIDIRTDWGPLNLYIRDKSFNQDAYMIALGNIFVGPKVFIESPTDVTFTAGTSVKFYANEGEPLIFKAEKGSKFKAFISEF